MNDPMLPLPGLSSANGKPVVAKFDGGLLSSDGGVLALREVEERLGVVATGLPPAWSIVARAIRSRTVWRTSFVFGF